MMQPAVDAVVEFHTTFRVPLQDSWSDGKRRDLRRRLLREEYQEYLDAEVVFASPEKTLDALVDLVYVAIGTAVEYGFDFAGAWEAVHKANMAKLGPDGQPMIRPDGKVLKPAGWEAPDLRPFLPADLR